MKGAFLAIEIDKVAEQALQLSRSQRAYLAEKLLESLDQEEPVELSEAWKAEIKRRCAEVDRGEVELIPGEQVFTEAERLLRG